MEFNELKRFLESAAENGTLMTSKHDPYNRADADLQSAPGR